MLIAQNCGGLKQALIALAALTACTIQSSPPPSPSPTSPAQSQAADVRTRMDLLLSEHVMIVAKESAAAVNHSDEYTAYASLLGLNAADLSRLVARGFGNTAGAQFMNVWSAQNGFLVDYAIGVVTHNDDKAKSAMNDLSSTFAPQLTQLIATMSQLPADPTRQLIVEQVGEDKAFIDDVFAGNFKAYYADLHRAYAHTSRLGDLLAEQIAIDFPDRFPGNTADPSVDARVTLNLDLQEHSYLATMATDAALSQRDAERTAALQMLSTDIDSLSAIVEDSRFALTWRQEISSLQTYALNQDPAARATLTNTVVSQLASVTRAKPNLIAEHENVTIKVVDDQRTKAPSLAQDDRAAATSMQPIADSIE
jgi:hypothetical protein